MEQGKEGTIIGPLTLRASRAQDHGGLWETAQSRRSQGIAPPPPHPVWLRAAARSSNSPALLACPAFLPCMLPRPEESAALRGSLPAVFRVRGECRDVTILLDSVPSHAKVLMLSWDGIQ